MKRVPGSYQRGGLMGVPMVRLYPEDERREWWERFNKAREAREQAEQAEREPIVVGVPAVEGLSAFESMIAAAGYTSVNAEFGRPRPTFLDDERAAGQRQLAENAPTGAGETAGPHSVTLLRPLNPRRLTPGVRLRVELDQIVEEPGPFGRRRPGPHRVGRAEVLDDGRLAVWITGASEAGRMAQALLAEEMVDVWLWGSRPTVRLRP
jgi:hypothetical protein